MVRLFFIVVDGFEVNEGIMFANLGELNLKICKNSLIQPFSSILGCNGYMVITVINTMRQFYKFHSSILLVKTGILEETTSLGLTPGGFK